MKKNKIPRIFRKKYTIKTLHSKILYRIHIPKDREMIKKLFVENSDGNMVVVQNIPEDIFKRLKPLAKSIKKNKGMVSRWKLSIMLFIVALTLVFSLFYKDKLLTKVVESGLESVFQSDVRINGLKLSLLKGSISYNTLVIADAGNSMRNLLETGPSEFRINIADLTRKRVRIEEMSLTGVKWNTAGNYVHSAESVKSDKKSLNGSFDILSLKPDELNYKSILDQQRNNLTSLNLINKVNQDISSITKKWEAVYSNKSKEIKNLQADVLSFKSLSVNGIGSVEEGLSKIGEIKKISARANKLKEDLFSLQDDFRKDQAVLFGMKAKIKNAVDSDYAYLDNLLDLSSGEMGSLASSFVESYIRNRWADWYENGLKFLKVYRRFKDRVVDKSEERKGLSRDSGREIPFPSPDGPGFLIEHILLSGGDKSSGVLSSELENVSNEPDKLAEPLTFLVDWRKGESRITLDGTLDMRTNSQQPFYMKIQSPSNRILLDKGVPFLNISRLSSVSDIKGESMIPRDQDTVLTSLSITLSDFSIDQTDMKGTLSQTIRNIFNNIDQIDLEADTIAGEDGLEELVVKSDFDDILSAELDDYRNAMEKDMKTKLKKGFLEYISPSIKKNEILQKSVITLNKESAAQISSVENLEKILDNKQIELEKRIKGATSEIQNKMDKKASQLQTEAAKKAQEETSKIIDNAAARIKLPGF